MINKSNSFDTLRVITIQSCKLTVRGKRKRIGLNQ